MVKVSIALACLVAVAAAGTAGCKPRDKKNEAQAQPATSGAAGQAPAAAPPAEAAPTAVELKTLLADYKDNEVRADGLYKGKRLRVAGTVGDVKKDLLGGMYVTVGTGKQFEIPTVQCMLEDDQVAKASALKKGGKVTVVGEATGLMMNVLLKPCAIE